MKILHLIPTLLSGGAERQLVGLVQNSDAAKFEHIVCVISDASFFGLVLSKAGSEVIELGCHGKRPFASATRSFSKVVRDVGPDIVHSWLYDANIVSRLSTYFGRKVPLITSWQLPDYEPSAIAMAGWNPRKVAGLKLIDLITARLTKPYFVACSQAVKSSYERNFGYAGRGVKTIVNSVDPHALDHSPTHVDHLRDEFNLPANAFVFLNVGRLDPQKNQRLILKAFSELTKDLSNVYLLIAGTGGIEQDLKALAGELRLNDRVKFLGRRNDVGGLLALADVFVFPSLMEGLPVALIEAMCKSLPCIASGIEVFAEVIENGRNGILIDPRSVEELKTAMAQLYVHEELRRTLGKGAFETFNARFSFETTKKQWEELYLDVLLAGNG